MSEKYRVLRKSVAATGNFLPDSEGAGPCKAFAISHTDAKSIVVTSAHGVTFTAAIDATEDFKIFPIAATSWTGNNSAEIITLF